jgi:tRNA dimethylallyltransferase
MTVYRGMNIGTAKPTVDEQHEVSYHLLDVIEPHEEFSVSQFQEAARDATEMVWNLGGAVLYVGGTGLYGRAVIDNLTIPGQFPEERAALELRAQADLESLYTELKELDPIAAERMEPTNARRIVRALEVSRGSGRPFSSFGDGLTTYPPERVVQIGLTNELEQLDHDIELRFRQWMENGLLEEVEQLLASPQGLSRTARQAVGYKELFGYFDGRDIEECVAEAIQATRQLARRQRRWFRRDPRIRWFSDAELAAQEIRQVLQSPDGFVRD